MEDRREGEMYSRSVAKESHVEAFRVAGEEGLSRRWGSGLPGQDNTMGEKGVRGRQRRSSERGREGETERDCVFV